MRRGKRGAEPEVTTATRKPRPSEFKYFTLDEAICERDHLKGKLNHNSKDQVSKSRFENFERIINNDPNNDIKLFIESGLTLFNRYMSKRTEERSPQVKKAIGESWLTIFKHNHKIPEIIEPRKYVSEKVTDSLTHILHPLVCNANEHTVDPALRMKLKSTFTFYSLVLHEFAKFYVAQYVEHKIGRHQSRVFNTISGMFKKLKNILDSKENPWISSLMEDIDLAEYIEHYAGRKFDVRNPQDYLAPEVEIGPYFVLFLEKDLGLVRAVAIPEAIRPVAAVPAEKVARTELVASEKSAFCDLAKKKWAVKPTVGLVLHPRNSAENMSSKSARTWQDKYVAGKENNTIETSVL